MPAMYTHISLLMLFHMNPLGGFGTLQSWMLQLGFSAKKADGAAGGIQRQGTGTPGNSGAISAPSATAEEPAKPKEPNHSALEEVGSLADHAYTCTAPGQSPLLVCLKVCMIS